MSYTEAAPLTGPSNDAKDQYHRLDSWESAKGVFKNVQ